MRGSFRCPPLALGRNHGKLSFVEMQMEMACINGAEQAYTICHCTCLLIFALNYLLVIYNLSFILPQLVLYL